MRKDQYILKNDYRQPVGTPTLCPKGLNKIDLSEKIWIDEKGEPQSDGLVSLFYPEHVSAVMRNYLALKSETAAKFQSDFYYLMQDFDNLLKRGLQYQYPMYYDLFLWKTQEKSNAEIQDLLKEKYQTTYSPEHISSLWRNKIPKILAEQAKADYLIWHYTEVERGQWKRCSCCGERKLAHPKFFTRNGTAKDGWYSICKACRQAKNKDKKS